MGFSAATSGVAVGGLVGTGVTVGDGVSVGRGVSVGVTVDVAVLVGVLVGVTVLVNVGDGTDVWVAAGSAAPQADTSKLKVIEYNRNSIFFFMANPRYVAIYLLNRVSPILPTTHQNL